MSVTSVVVFAGTPALVERFLGFCEGARFLTAHETAPPGFKIPGVRVWQSAQFNAVVLPPGEVPAADARFATLVFTAGADARDQGEATAALRERAAGPVWVAEASAAPTALWAGDSPFPYDRAASFGPLTAEAAWAVYDYVRETERKRAAGVPADVAHAAPALIASLAIPYGRLKVIACWYPQTLATRSANFALRAAGGVAYVTLWEDYPLFSGGDDTQIIARFWTDRYYTTVSVMWVGDSAGVLPTSGIGELALGNGCLRVSVFDVAGNYAYRPPTLQSSDTS